MDGPGVKKFQIPSLINKELTQKITYGNNNKRIYFKEKTQYRRTFYSYVMVCVNGFFENIFSQT